MAKEKKQIDKLKFEKEEQAKGRFFIAGVDEVGRGPLAGPVCVAAVIMPLDDLIDGVDDSKKISEKKRELLFEQIKKGKASPRFCFAVCGGDFLFLSLKIKPRCLLSFAKKPIL